MKVDSGTFKRWINALRASYELRPVAEDIEAYWYKALGDVDQRALLWIRDQIKTRWPEKFPRHLQDRINDLHYEWLRETGQMQNKKACPECDHGMVVVRHTESELFGEDHHIYQDGTLLEYAYACKLCRPQARAAKLTKSEARNRGMRLIDGSQPFNRRLNDSYGTVDQAVSAMTDRWETQREEIWND